MQDACQDVGDLPGYETYSVGTLFSICRLWPTISHILYYYDDNNDNNNIIIVVVIYIK